MRSLDPSFDEHNYGFRSFGEFLTAMNDTVNVVRGEQDLQITLLENQQGAKTDDTTPVARTPKNQE